MTHGWEVENGAVRYPPIPMQFRRAPGGGYWFPAPYAMPMPGDYVGVTPMEHSSAGYEHLRRFQLSVSVLRLAVDSPRAEWPSD